MFIDSGPNIIRKLCRSEIFSGQSYILLLKDLGSLG